MAADPKKSFLLRIDPKLWAEVERWSAEELRSVNGQIEFILREAVRRRRGAGAPTEHLENNEGRDPSDRAPE